MTLSFLVSLILSTALAGPTKCPVKGDLVRWQFAYCFRQVETDDCESPLVGDCVDQLMKSAKKKSECDQKKHLKSMIDESCKKSGPCPKIPNVVKNGCGGD